MAKLDLWDTLYPKDGFEGTKFEECLPTAREIASELSLLNPDQEIYGIISDFLVVGKAQFPVDQVLAG